MCRHRMQMSGKNKNRLWRIKNDIEQTHAYAYAAARPTFTYIL